MNKSEHLNILPAFHQQHSFTLFVLSGEHSNILPLGLSSDGFWVVPAHPNQFSLLGR